MPNSKEHVENCERLDIERWICREVNKYMDEPSQRIPGCGHRNYRHRLEDCLSIAKALASGKSREEALKVCYQSLLACLKHIEDDCKRGSEICKASLSRDEVERILRNIQDLSKQIESFCQL
jgi:citrate synthase